MLGENRVVFMGDSITEGWHFDGPSPAFAGKPYINRGISGQTTPQMVLRFHQDVIALQPKVVVILAGTNDIAGNTGPMTLEQTEDNLAAMAEMATANHIRVVLCSVLPAFDYPWQPGLTPALSTTAWRRTLAGTACIQRLPVTSLWPSWSKRESQRRSRSSGHTCACEKSGIAHRAPARLDP